MRTKTKLVGIDGASPPSSLPYDAAYGAGLDFQASYPHVCPDGEVNYLVDDVFVKLGAMELVASSTSCLTLSSNLLYSLCIWTDGWFSGR